MGIPVGDHNMFTLSFADDQVIFAQDSFDIEYMMRKLHTEYQQWGLSVSLKKTEYLVVNSEANFEVLIDEDTAIKQVEKFKYLGAIVDRNGIGGAEIKHRIQEGRKIIGCLNSLWWDRNISNHTKKRIGKTMVESTLCYGSEIWTINADLKRRLNAVEMDYLRRSARTSRLQHVTNEVIRDRLHARESVLDRIEIRSLRWFGHLMRMPEHRWPRRMFEWVPPGRKKRGRPRRSWNEGIRQSMEQRQLDVEMTQDREAWRMGLGRRH